MGERDDTEFLFSITQGLQFQFFMFRFPLGKVCSNGLNKVNVYCKNYCSSLCWGKTLLLNSDGSVVLLTFYRTALSGGLGFEMVYGDTRF